MELAREILGDGVFYASCHESVLLDTGRTGSATPELVALRRARVAVLGETDRAERLNGKRVKRLTSGQDSVAARDLYQRARDAKSFVPKASFVLPTNHRPVFDDTDAAMVDRVRQIPFLHRFPKNPAYAKDLRENHLDEVFSWAVQGAVRWYAGETLDRGVPSVLEESMQTWRQELDFLRDFISDRCEVDPAKSVTREEVWNSFRHWMEGNPAVRCTRAELYKRLAATPGVAARQTGKERARGFSGIGLLSTT